MSSNPLEQTPPPPSLPLMIDAKAARVVLGIGENKLWQLTNINAIPSRKIGRSVRYVVAELHSWIEAGCPTHHDAGDRIRKEGRS